MYPSACKLLPAALLVVTDVVFEAEIDLEAIVVVGEVVNVDA